MGCLDFAAKEARATMIFLMVMLVFRVGASLMVYGDSQGQVSWASARSTAYLFEKLLTTLFPLFLIAGGGGQVRYLHDRLSLVRCLVLYSVLLSCQQSWKWSRNDRALCRCIVVVQVDTPVKSIPGKMQQHSVDRFRLGLSGKGKGGGSRYMPAALIDLFRNADPTRLFFLFPPNPLHPSPPPTGFHQVG